MAQAAAAGGARQQGAFPDDAHGWKREGCDLLRAITGGAIVGMPLLYTMEMWFHGAMFSEWHLLGILGASLAVNFLFSLLSGFREEYSVGEALMEAVTAVGIGILLSAAILWIIGELNFEVAPTRIIGKILIEAAAVSVGVSFANAQVLGKSRTGEDGGGQGQGGEQNGGAERQQRSMRERQREQWREDLRDVGATLAGSTVFALNIAPTEEVLMIASRLTPWQLLGVLAASIVLCYIILFASGFEQHRVIVDSMFQHPWAETALSSSLSLGVAFVLLLLVGQREAFADPSAAVAATVTLGLPAIVGGAAGRLVV